ACKCLSKFTGIGSLQEAFLKEPQDTFLCWFPSFSSSFRARGSKSTVQAKSLYDLAERNRWQFIFEPGDGNQIVLLVIEKLRDSSLGVVRLRPTRASRKLGKPGFQSRGKAYGKH